MENVGYYLFLLAVIVVAVIIIKKVASCIVRSIVLGVVAIVLAYLYYRYGR